MSRGRPFRLFEHGTLLLGVALLVRLWGIWYGLPSLYIGDESFHLLNALSMGARRSLEPLYFVYPTFHGYVLLALYGAAFVVGRLTGVFSDAVDFGLRYFFDPTVLFLIGRALSAVAGAFTVWLVYRVGRRYFSKQVAVLAGTLLAFSYGHVYSSHWILLEAPVALMAMLGLAALFRYHDSARTRDLWLAGGLIGLAISTKYNAGFLVLSLLLAVWWRGRASRRLPWAGWAHASGAAVLGFVVGTPYWLLEPGRFLTQFLDTSARMEQGMLGHVARIPILWPLVEMVRSDWGVGVLLVAGLFLAFPGARRDRRRLLLLAFVLPSLLVLGFWRRTGIGYLMPIYPALSLLAADAVVRAASRVGRWAVPAISAMLALGLLQVVLYDVRLSGEDTRAEAEAWIAANIPAGATIGYENFAYGPNLFDPQRFLRNPEAGLLPPPAVQAIREEARRRRTYRLIHLRKDFHQDDEAGPAGPAPYPDLEALRRRGVQFLMLSSANYSRYFDKPPSRRSPLWREYRLGRAFYESIFQSSTAVLVAEFTPSFWHPGPVVRIYRILRSP